MRTEIIGILPHRFYSEVYADPESEFDIDFIRDCAWAHEAAGYDRVLIANSAHYPDSIPLATWVTSVTERLKVMIAHRPGFIVPTMTARMLATIDQVSKGRAGVHIITGSNEIEMHADGDYTGKAERYRRSRQYVEVMKKMWADSEPFDYDSEHYKVEGAYASVKPHNGKSIPVFWGGSSEDAIVNGAQVADIFALPGAEKERILGLVKTVRDQAASHGRDIELLISTRVVLGETEEEAWAYAMRHLRALVTELHDRGDLPHEAGETRETAIERAVAQAAEGSRDGIVFSAYRKVGIGRPVANCLVGTPEQLIDHLSDLARAGVSRFILAGYDPRTYPAEFGRIFLPRLRAALAEIEEKEVA